MQPETSPREGENQFLTFLLSGDLYALPILRVLEIVAYPPVTRVPTTPAFIRGVMNLRGRVVPVVDLAAKLGLPETPVARRTTLLVLELHREEAGPLVLGVMADAVDQVVEFAPSEIEAPPEFGAPIRVEFLTGLGKVDGTFVLILDIDRVMSVSEISVVAELQAEDEGTLPAETPGEKEGESA